MKKNPNIRGPWRHAYGYEYNIEYLVSDKFPKTFTNF